MKDFGYSFRVICLITNWLHIMTDIDIHSILDIAKNAGEKILSVYDASDFSVKLKSDHSPLTRADILSHNIIESNLMKLYPNIPIISEESSKKVTYKKRKDWKIFWLVDPLDGTKDFLKKNDQFTVNIALIVNNQPHLGVVYAPALHLLYFAEKGKGAYKQVDNKKIILKSSSLNEDKIRIVVSNSHLSKETKYFIENLQQNNRSIETVSVGSSLKFCWLAEGNADIYPRLGPTMEWDTAAGQCIAMEANKEVIDFKKGSLLQYNKMDLKNPWFIVR